MHTIAVHLVAPLLVLLEELLKRQQLLGDALHHVQPVHAQHDLRACMYTTVLSHMCVCVCVCVRMCVHTFTHMKVCALMRTN